MFHLVIRQQTGYDNYKVWGMGENLFCDDWGICYKKSLYLFDGLCPVWKKLPAFHKQRLTVCVPGVGGHSRKMKYAEIQLRAIWGDKDVRGCIVFTDVPLNP